jgi:hypothetical protein
MQAIAPTAMTVVGRCLVAAAATAGGSVLPLPAVAHGEWDIEAYDNCMAEPHGPATDSGNLHNNWHFYCCQMSGGVWHNGNCVAPVEASATFEPPTPSSVPTNTFSPEPAPPQNTT